jgi:hypothetical protein
VEAIAGRPSKTHEDFSAEKRRKNPQKFTLPAMSDDLLGWHGLKR